MIPDIISGGDGVGSWDDIQHTHTSLSFGLSMHLPRFWCEHMPPNFEINFGVNTCPQIFDEPTIPWGYKNLEARQSRRNTACVHLLCCNISFFLCFLLLVFF